MSIWKVLFGTKKHDLYEEVSDPMVPTAGVGDDGGGWHRERRGDGWRYVREVVNKPPKDKDNWVEGSPGLWHKKYPPK